MAPVILRDLHSLQVAGTEKVIEWCRENGFLARSMKCSVCDKKMKAAPSKANDRSIWQCWVRGSKNPHRTKKSIRTGSWFANSKLPIIDLLIMTYFWSIQSTNKMIMKEMNRSAHAVVDWKNYCREECMNVCANESNVLGGEGVVVEIDESKFGKRKDNRGVRVEGNWAIIGVEQGTSKCFICLVANRSKEVLLDIIQRFVLPGTTIISDCWKVYDCLADEGYQQMTVNHSLHFVDHQTGAHSHTIKSTWNAIKRSLPATSNRSEALFDSYLAEFMWRRMNKEREDLFMHFMKGVSEKYVSDWDE